MELEPVEYLIHADSVTSELSIIGDYNYWRGQINLLGERVPKDQNRLMSYESARVTLSTASEEGPFYLEFDPRVGSEAEMMNKFQSFYQLDWIVPILDSTILVDGQRSSEPYWIRVQVDGDWLETTFDITGNLYDRLYIQPETN